MRLVNQKRLWLNTTLAIIFLSICAFSEASSNPEDYPAVEKLPDPFLFLDGSCVKTQEDWVRRRAEIRELILSIEYGYLPDAPGNVKRIHDVRSEIINDGVTRAEKHLLSMGPDNKIHAQLDLYIPATTGKPCPVILNIGPGCPIIKEVNERGYIFAGFGPDRFDRSEEGKPKAGAVEQAYPDMEVATLAAWAWGASRMLDYLETLPEVDDSKVIITGHSRCGKAALLAGVVDERFAIVNPNGSGCGGAGLYRILGPNCEDLEAITRPERWQEWFHKDFRNFAGKEAHLPFDQHFMRALVAPRLMLSTDALEDHWANPLGTQLNYLAAQPVYDFLGVPDNNFMHFRPGGHDHTDVDFRVLLDFANWQFFGKETKIEFNILPFPDQKLDVDWSGVLCTQEGTDIGGAVIYDYDPATQLGDAVFGTIIADMEHDHPGRCSHGGPVCVQYANGDIVAFYANTSDHNIDGWSEYAMSKDGGKTWDKYNRVQYSYDVYQKDPTEPVWVEEALVTSKGTVVLFLTYLKEGKRTQNGIIKSYDNGGTWTEYEPFEPVIVGYPCAVAVSGDTNYVLFDSNEGPHVLYVSTDDGMTWVKRSTLSLDDDKWYGTMCLMTDGRILAGAYSEKNEKEFYYCISTDEGKTWSEQKAAVVAKGIRDPELACLDGKYYLHGRSGHGGEGAHRYVLYRSADGENWNDGTIVNSDTRGPDGYGHNCIVTKDGVQEIMVLYSIVYEGKDTNEYVFFIRPQEKCVEKESTPIQVSADYPGGNIVVEKIDGDIIYLHQDIRDTEGWWFYWNFSVNHAAGKQYTFQFTDKNVFGNRGPAVSTDNGKTWSWSGSEHIKDTSFSYTFPSGSGEVRFAYALPYQETHLKCFLDQYKGNKNLLVRELCKTRKGRTVEQVHVGKLDGDPRYRVLLTCRHHACESTASYVLEGALSAVLADTATGRWFRENVEVLAIPFMDKDGVEEGDQGKNRKPRDHGRDYAGESLYPAVGALRSFAPEWSDGLLRIALDLHCPYLKDQFIYLVGSENETIWKEQCKFGRILDSISNKSLPYRSEDNLPFGQAWNKASNYSAGKSMSQWAGVLEGIKLSSAIEIPYANAGKATITQKNAREFGVALVIAMQQYLETL